MRAIEATKSIVKGYFNNAIIIDDDLDERSLFESQEAELSITESEISAFTGDPFVDAEVEAMHSASSENDEYKSLPNRTFREFVNEGFVTYAHPFRYSNMSEQIENLKKVLTNAKLLIVDWNLEGVRAVSSSQRMGEIAIRLIQNFSESGKGLKCAVIYTKETLSEVAESLREYFCIIKANVEYVFFQDKQADDEVSLLGFVLPKTVEPSDIIDRLSTFLLEERSLTVHFIDSANRLDESIHKTLTKFNAPFEKVILTQMLTSEIPNEHIVKFVNDLLLSNILEDHRNSPLFGLNILFEQKKKRLIRAIEIILEDRTRFNVDDILSVVNINKKGKIKQFFDREDTWSQLLTTIASADNNTLETFRQSIQRISENEEIARYITIIVLMLDSYIADRGEFTRSYYSQLYEFTKIFKYQDDTHSNEISTGTIYRKRDSGNEFLVCITPFCDVFRPEGIEGVYKFLVGEMVEPSPNDLKNESLKVHVTAVPIPSEKTVKFVKWSFYHTECMKIDDLQSKYDRIITLKKDYIQKIMNRYISYQSRVGVDELFYKESAYINAFHSFVSFPGET